MTTTPQGVLAMCGKIGLFCLVVGVCLFNNRLSADLNAPDLLSFEYKAHTFSDLARSSLKSDPIGALSYAEQALNESMNSGKSESIADALSLIGWIYFSIGDFDNAINCHLNALDYSQSDREQGNYAGIYFHLGKIYSGLHKHERAAILLSRFLDLSLDNPDHHQRKQAAELLIQSYSKLGYTYEALKVQEIFWLELAFINPVEKENKNEVAVIVAGTSTNLLDASGLERQIQTNRKAENLLLLILVAMLMMLMAWIGMLLKNIYRKRNLNIELRRKYRLLKVENKNLKDFNGQLESSVNKAHSANHAKSNFLATMSHEIRTPLNGILGMTRILLDSNLNSEQQEYTHNIYSSSNNLLFILNDILDFSKIEAGKMDLEIHGFDLENLLEDVKKLFDQSAKEKSLNFYYTIDTAVPRFILGDSNRIRQILVNLVSNAMKFTNEGEISIQVDIEGNVPVKSEAFNLRIKVSDTGIGIPEEKKISIFNSFQQAEHSTTRKYGGVGLGLSITKKLVKMMDGKIQVESRPGEGSEFTFTVQSKIDTSQSSINHHKKKHSSGKIEKVLSDQYPIKILVAEDNEINQVIMRKILEKHGYKVKIASNGNEVLAHMSKLDYDLIFMDIQMPEMDGVETTLEIRKMKENKNHPVIIAMTANAMTGFREEYLSKGMNDYVSKPFRPEELENIIVKWGSKICNGKQLSA